MRNERILWGVICGAIYALSAASSLADTIYVDQDATGANDGITWVDAYTDLQSALAVAVASDQVWVADGTYKASTNGDRTVSFQLVANTGLLGGFNGSETQEDQREPIASETILSGDIGTPSDPGDNTHRIVIGTDESVIDGFTIAGGRADDGVYTTGGGMYNNGATNVSVLNCRFEDNAALTRGGMDNRAGAIVGISNCVFAGNFTLNALGDGGAIYSHAAETAVTIEDSTFIENGATHHGGAIYSVQASTIIRNSIFAGNRSGYSGGAVAAAVSCPMTVEGTVFSGNIAGTNSVSANGGGLWASGNSSVMVDGVFFTGNEALGINGSAGALYALNVSAMHAQNVLFAGNQATNALANAGAFYIQGVSNASSVINATFHGNSSGRRGGAFGSTSADSDMKNVILWQNVSGFDGAEAYIAGAMAPTISFSDVDGGVNGSKFSGTATDEGNNTSSNPLFVGGGNGAWTASSTYDVETGKTVLSDTGTSWASNEHAGKVLQPDAASVRRYLIIANTANNITVWGNATDGTSGDSYQITDYSLNFGSQAIDAGTSSGAPATDIVGASRPQNAGFDIGAYETVGDRGTMHIFR